LANSPYRITVAGAVLPGKEEQVPWFRQARPGPGDPNGSLLTVRSLSLSLVCELASICSYFRFWTEISVAVFQERPWSVLFIFFDFTQAGPGARRSTMQRRMAVFFFQPCIALNPSCLSFQTPGTNTGLYIFLFQLGRSKDLRACSQIIGPTARQAPGDFFPETPGSRPDLH
jgi:hypothetical protein